MHLRSRFEPVILLARNAAHDGKPDGEVLKSESSVQEGLAHGQVDDFLPTGAVLARLHFRAAQDVAADHLIRKHERSNRRKLNKMSNLLR